MSRAFRLGLFIAATLAILLAGIFAIGSKQFRFTSTYRIQTQFQNVIGLQPGAEVRVGGLHEGTVKSIDLPQHPGAAVTVVMDMEPKTRGVINKGSTAAISSEGLIGDKYVEISFGSPGGAPLGNGDSIQSQAPIRMEDLLKKADQILGTANDTMRNLENTSQSFDKVSSDIASGKGSVGALINDRTLYQRASAGVADFQEDMEALKHNFLLRGFFSKRGYEDEAELTKHAVSSMPAGNPLGDYTLDASKLFGKGDSAKLKSTKALEQAGHFLESHPFGVAVVAVSTGPTGETEKSRKLAEARAMVVRDYLADHFRFDDTRLKTFAIGKTEQGPPEGQVDIRAFRTGGSKSE